jgi:hypothetical protein
MLILVMRFEGGQHFSCELDFLWLLIWMWKKNVGLLHNRHKGGGNPWTHSGQRFDLPHDVIRQLFLKCLADMSWIREAKRLFEIVLTV